MAEGGYLTLEKFNSVSFRNINDGCCFFLLRDVAGDAGKNLQVEQEQDSNKTISTYNNNKDR